MVVILFLLIAVYFFVVLSGIARLALEHYPRLQKEIPHAAGISQWFSKVFDLLNIPLAMITVSFCVLGIVRGVITDIGSLLCSGGLVALSFIVNTISERSFAKEIFETDSSANCEYKASFAYLDTYNEITKLNSNVIAHISESGKHFQKQVQNTSNTLSRVNTAIENYLTLQHEDVAGLVTVKNQCESVYKALEQVAHKTWESFDQFTGKIDYSVAALEYCGEAQTLLDDINSSFKDTFSRGHLTGDAEFMKKIGTLTSNMHILAVKCDAIKSFPKTYTDAIGLYSAKMDAALKSFEDNNKSKQADISKLCEEFSKAVTDENAEMKNTLEGIAVYLQKNMFVLTKVLETYKNESYSSRGLKELLQKYQ